MSGRARPLVCAPPTGDVLCVSFGSWIVFGLGGKNVIYFGMELLVHILFAMCTRRKHL